jgi:hypothetical protein
MKKYIFLFSAIVIFSISLQAQWSFNGTQIYNSNTGFAGIGNSSPTSLLDVAKSMTNPDSAVYINAAGNVGIGTANPTEKLSVNGNIKCKQVEVTLTGWSDFVFQEDYSLMPLEELYDYISQHKHLPGVPSTQEVITNGNNLGEMDAILLQKIEELTLYVIDLKKENEALRLLLIK